MSSGNLIIQKKKNLNEEVQAAIINRHYRTQYSNVLKFKADNPPEAVGRQAIDSVWKKYTKVNPKWAQYYWSINNIASPYYIPTDLWFSRICRKMNSLDRFGWPRFQDKNYLDLIFQGVRQPEIVVRNIGGQFLDSGFRGITKEEAAELCKSPEELLIKPSISSKGGRGIKFLEDNEKDQSSLLRIFQERDKDFVVQKAVRQHPAMAELNPDSINTVRVQTLLWNGEVIILNSLVRVGVKGCRIDNPHTSNGVSCVLTEKGKMIGIAYDRGWHPKTALPNGMPPEGFEVPFYGRILDTVKNLQYRVPHSRLIGWDMTVSEKGDPILIEANLDYPEIYFHQLGKGPLISDPVLFEEIMRFVFHK